MSAWVAPRGGEVVAAELAAALDAEERGDCPEFLPDPPLGWMCTRDRDHAGRHVAQGAASEVYAAWPGADAPALADFRPAPREWADLLPGERLWLVQNGFDKARYDAALRDEVPS